MNIFVELILIIVYHFRHGKQVDQMNIGMDDFPLDPDDKLGSFDEGDPQTTNLYVGNLAPQVTLHDTAYFLTEYVSQLLFSFSLHLDYFKWCSASVVVGLVHN